MSGLGNKIFYALKLKSCQNMNKSCKVRKYYQLDNA